MDRWRIVYPITPVTQVARFPGYPALGVRFIFDANALTAIEHEVEVPDGGDALLLSQPTIWGLLESLEMHWRLPTRITINGAVDPSRLNAENSVARSTSRVLRQVAASMSIVLLPHTFPPETAVGHAAADLWLTRQLQLFNLAEKNADDATAIRLLYLVWEALRLRLRNMKNFRYVRNFVSHVEFTGPTLAFIEKELGVGTDHYDPFNEAHRTLLRDWRQRAREVIRVELERNLGL